MRHSFALVHGEVTLRVVQTGDTERIQKLMLGNRDWLRPWEATNPDGPNSFDIRSMIKGLRRQMKADQGLPLVIEYQNEIVGQLNVSNIVYGSVSSAMLGYWIAPEVAGRGITPTAVALISDYLLNTHGLHRVEIGIRPENSASLRVVEKLGFRYEGLKERFIHINGKWCDHYIFALTREEVSDGILSRWIRNRVPAQSYPWSNTPS